MAEESNPTQLAADSVLVKSEAMPEGSVQVRGYDFNEGVHFGNMMKGACLKLLHWEIN